MYEDIEVDWRRVRQQSDEEWGYWRCLYIYVDVRDHAVLYLGKADRCTVRERWRGRHKDDLREWLADAGTERVFLHVGEIDWGKERRYSPEKLADLEALLIKRLQPPANIVGKGLRGVSRRGTRVSCVGEWPCARSVFLDR